MDDIDHLFEVNPYLRRGLEEIEAEKRANDRIRMHSSDNNELADFWFMYICFLVGILILAIWIKCYLLLQEPSSTPTHDPGKLNCMIFVMLMNNTICNIPKAVGI